MYGLEFPRDNGHGVIGKDIKLGYDLNIRKLTSVNINVNTTLVPRAMVIYCQLQNANCYKSGNGQEAVPFTRQHGGTNASLMGRYSFANKHFVPIDRGWKARVKIVGFRYDDGYLEKAPKMSTSRYRLSRRRDATCKIKRERMLPLLEEREAAHPSSTFFGGGWFDCTTSAAE